MSRFWRWVLIIFIVVVAGPMGTFIFLTWQYPVRTTGMVVSLYQRLPAGLHNNPVMWKMVAAYLRAAVDQDQPPQVAEELRGNKRTLSAYVVVALGDSTTLGPQVAANQRWTFRLQKMMHSRLHKTVRVINAGISGEMAPMGEKRLERDVLSLHPDLVIFGYLINDGRIIDLGADGQGQTLIGYDEFLRTMDNIITKLQVANIPVMGFTCHPIPNAFFGHERVYWYQLQEVMLSARVAALNKLFAARQVPVADTFEAIHASERQPDFYLPDNLHLNAAGHKLEADLIFQKWVNEILPRPGAQL